MVNHGTSPVPKLPKVSNICRPWSAEKEKELRARVVQEALSWCKTPYVQQADVKGSGVDCAMLLVRCWVDCGITERFDPRPYPPTWHIHNSEERYLDWMHTMALEVETPQAGDIALFIFGQCYSHGGIMIDENTMVNAHAGKRGKTGPAVTLTGLNEAWLFYDRASPIPNKPRPRKFFDVFGRLRQEIE